MYKNKIVQEHRKDDAKSVKQILKNLIKKIILIIATVEFLTAPFQCINKDDIPINFSINVNVVQTTYIN